MNRRYVLFAALLASVIIAADQLSKHWLLETVMVPPHVEEITSFLNLVLSWNKGVTFGLLNQGNEFAPYILSGVAAIILIALIVWLLRATSLAMALGLGSVMGGAIGNVVDRLQFGAVVDFIDFHFMGHHWYAFNVADSCIVGGVILLLIENMICKPGKN